MKKYLPYILAIASVIIIFGVFGAHRAEAGFLNNILGFNQLIATIGNFYLIIVSKVVAIAGYFSDAAISYSLTNAGAGALSVVNEGWALSRDVANLFFIFILLYIAIATILQLSGYGMKELLVTVIILALLVNFSLVITKVIIDGSNVLALEFYNKLTDIQYKGGGVSPSGGSKPSLSEALVAGLNMQTLFGIGELKDSKTGQSSDPLKLKDGQEATLVQIGIITLLGSSLFLVLAFVLFAAGVLFVMRTAILWILMILSPLAFLFMALPATSGYAKQWWKKLFEQSFFAPAYMFLFYFVVKIVSSGAIIKGLRGDNQTFGAAFGSPNDANVKLVLNFAILIVLAVASLIVAKQMGAEGAGAMQAWGQKAKNWGQGQAGKIAKRGAVGLAGGLSEAALKKMQGDPQGAFAKTLRATPFAVRGLSKLSSLEEKRKKDKTKEYEKRYGGYSEAGLAEMGRRETDDKYGMINRGPRLTEAKQKVINKLAVDKAVEGAKREWTGEEGEREPVSKQIESKQREIIKLRGDKSDEGIRKMVEAVLTMVNLQKSINKKFSKGDEGGAWKEEFNKYKDEQANKGASGAGTT